MSHRCRLCPRTFRKSAHLRQHEHACHPVGPRRASNGTRGRPIAHAVTTSAALAEMAAAALVAEAVR